MNELIIELFIIYQSHQLLSLLCKYDYLHNFDIRINVRRKRLVIIQ